jgi:hypothetical protein
VPCPLIFADPCSGAKAIFTQDVIYRGDKALPLFERVLESEAPRIVTFQFHFRRPTGVFIFGFDLDFSFFYLWFYCADGIVLCFFGMVPSFICLSLICFAPCLSPSPRYPSASTPPNNRPPIQSQIVLPGQGDALHASIRLRADPAADGVATDLAWSDFLVDAAAEFDAVAVDPEHVCNILFSSGTTGMRGRRGMQIIRAHMIRQFCVCFPFSVERMQYFVKALSLVVSHFYF